MLKNENYKAVKLKIHGAKKMLRQKLTYTAYIFSFFPIFMMSVTDLMAQPSEQETPQIHDYEAQKVPSGKWWRLCWSSPYEPFEVHPAYDIRVSSGEAYIGREFDRRTYVSAFARYGSPQGPLDIAASSTEENTCVWLPAGAVFNAANSMVSEHIQVTEKNNQ